MATEFEVDSIDGVCDSKVPTLKEEWWIFTFGCGRDAYGNNAGKAVKVYASSYEEAREKMCEKYGTKWAFQYSESEWTETENDPNRFWDMEEIVEVIE